MLPESKQAAIRRLGIGRLDKVYLEFESVFWDNTVDTFSYVNEDWMFNVNYSKHGIGKPILCMFNSGPSCVKYSTMSDEEVVASAMAAVKAMFPHAPDTYKRYLRTNWSKDEFTKMSYTCLEAGSTP